MTPTPAMIDAGIRRAYPTFDTMSDPSRAWVRDKVTLVAQAVVDQAEPEEAHQLQQQIVDLERQLNEERLRADGVERELAEARACIERITAYVDDCDPTTLTVEHLEKRIRAGIDWRGELAERELTEVRRERDAALRRVDEVHEMLGAREGAAAEYALAAGGDCSEEKAPAGDTPVEAGASHILSITVKDPLLGALPFEPFRAKCWACDDYLPCALHPTTPPAAAPSEPHAELAARQDRLEDAFRAYLAQAERGYHALGAEAALKQLNQEKGARNG